MIKNLVIISLALLVTGCCGMVNCSPPTPSELQIQLFDASTEQDMFVSGQLNPDSIQVTYDDGTLAEFDFTSSNEEKFSWITIYENSVGNYDYRIWVGSTTEVLVSSDIKEIDSNCCPYLQVESIVVADYSFERTDYGIRFKIWIE